MVKGLPGSNRSPDNSGMADSNGDLPQPLAKKSKVEALLESPAKRQATRASWLLRITVPFRQLRPLVLGLIFLAPPALGQNANVTFYSTGSLLKADAKQTLTVKGEMPFIGWIFDGDRRLAYLQGARFMTVQLQAGQHTFAAGLDSKHAAKNSSLAMQLEAGQHYCIRLGLAYQNFVLVATHKGTVDPMDCGPAKAEARDSKPLDLKSVEKAAQSFLVSPTTSF